jgi:catechol 2,3-dioxygenase-like lactoylglutathione lyase family enzyme
MSDIINGTDFVCVGTQDIETARRFYGETLGLRESTQWGSMPAYEFETGSLTLAVMEMAAFGMAFSPNTSPIAFHVSDYDAARAELESRGVKFNHDTIDSGVCFQCYFNDPDGNIIGIHHRYAPREAS